MTAQVEHTTPNGKVISYYPADTDPATVPAGPASIEALALLVLETYPSEPDKYGVQVDENTRAIVCDKGVTVMRFDDGICVECAVNERVVIGAEV